MNTLTKIYRDFVAFFFAPHPWSTMGKPEMHAEIEFLRSENDYWRGNFRQMSKGFTELHEKFEAQRALIILQREVLSRPKPTPEIAAYEVKDAFNECTYWITSEPSNTYSAQEIIVNGLTFRPLTYAD